MNNKLIQTRVSKEVFRDLAKLAAANGWSMATLLRYLAIHAVKANTEAAK